MKVELSSKRSQPIGNNAMYPIGKDRRTDFDDSDVIYLEINHRTKNTLAMLIALLHQDFKSLISPDTRHAISQFERRVLAFSKLYGNLSPVCEDTNVGVRQYMEELCFAFATAVLEPIGIRCTVVADHGFLDARRCGRLGMIIVELVMNAAKHAFPESRNGVVQVQVALCLDGWRCVVSDNGVGTEGATAGHGTVILDRLAHSIQARIEGVSGRHGSTITIFLPV